MAMDYRSILRKAVQYKADLNSAESANDLNKAIVYRGRYIRKLQQLQTVAPNLSLPASLTGLGGTLKINDIITAELRAHQANIDLAIRENKQTSSIKKPVFSNELGLKIRRLHARVDQRNSTSNPTTRDNLKKDIASDSLGVAGTVVKAPLMITAKALSAIGPLAVTIAALPITVTATLICWTIDLYNKKPLRGIDNGVVKLNKELNKAVKQISTSVYENVGRL